MQKEVFMAPDGTPAASFCCLMTLWHQLHFEGGVDVYQLAKLTHYNRPGVFGTQVWPITQFLSNCLFTVNSLK